MDVGGALRVSVNSSDPSASVSLNEFEVKTADGTPVDTRWFQRTMNADWKPLATPGAIGSSTAIESAALPAGRYLVRIRTQRSFSEWEEVQVVRAQLASLTFSLRD
jgi:hypothetical protein